VDEQETFSAGEVKKEVTKKKNGRRRKVRVEITGLRKKGIHHKSPARRNKKKRKGSAKGIGRGRKYFHPKIVKGKGRGQGTQGE